LIERKSLKTHDGLTEADGITFEIDEIPPCHCPDEIKREGNLKNPG
jgi:hypothetical protein